MRVLVLAAVLLSAMPALGAQAVAVSVEELARASDAVVRGRVTTSRAQRTDDGLRVFTTYEVRTSAVLRGQAPTIAHVVVPGGVVGRFGQRVDAAPAIAPDEEVVLFLRHAGPDAFRVTGLAQGKFSVVGPVARPDLSELTFIRTSVRHGERRAEEMPLAELERRVRSIR
ncbi:hypothetical protein [Anaeromyxobacter oryzae]|nr:hypothetical protein [Anaeromyxobacter oryzae]